MPWGDPSVLAPHTLELANSGVKLGALYTQNWCAPSRGALLTGRYPQHSGYTKGGDGNDTGALETRWELIPKVLKRAGYRTVGVGKWHLGYPTTQHLPEKRGIIPRELVSYTCELSKP